MITHITVNPNPKQTESMRERYWKPFNHSIRIYASIIGVAQIGPAVRARSADMGESYQICQISVLPEGGVITLSGRLEGTPLKEALKFNIGDIGPHTSHCWLMEVKPSRTSKSNNQIVRFLITSDYPLRDRVLSLVVGPLAAEYMLQHFPKKEDMRDPIPLLNPGDPDEDQ